MSPVPENLQPPSDETLDAYRAAVLAYRKAFAIEGREKGVMKAGPHIPKIATLGRALAACSDVLTAIPVLEVKRLRYEIKPMTGIDAVDGFCPELR
jgi:hypothetical protein